MATFTTLKKKYGLKQNDTDRVIIDKLLKQGLDENQIIEVYETKFFEEGYTSAGDYPSTRAKALCRQIFDEIKIESERGKYLKKIITHLDNVLSHVSEFRNSSVLMKICKNFLQDRNIIGLEYFAVPTRIFKDEYIPVFKEKTIKDEKYKSIKRILVAGYNCYINNEDYFQWLQEIKNGEDSDFNGNYRDIIKLYNSLVKNNYVGSDRASQDGFYIFLCELYCDKQKKRYEELKSNYKIEGN